MCYRRITAAILDILIVSIIIASLASVMPLSKNAIQIANEYNNYLTNIDDFTKITASEKEQIIEMAYLFDRETSYFYVVVALVITIYFVFIPKWLNGKTIAQYIRKVKLVSENEEKVNLNQYIIRALLNSGLFLMILMPLFIYICNAIWYSNVTSILCIVQLIYWFISLIMLLIKKKTIHDYITKTKIIEVKR